MTEADTTELTEADTTVEPTVLEDAAPAKTEDLEERLVAEGEIAGDYLEELLDLLDFDGDIDLDVEGRPRHSEHRRRRGPRRSWSAARARCSTRCRS